MDCFLVLITSPVRPIPEAFRKRHVLIGDNAILVAADDMTTADVAELFMMGKTDDSGNETTGMVVKVTSYSGSDRGEAMRKVLDHPR